MSGYAIYDEDKNCLEVIRPNESTKRYIRCNNLDSKNYDVFGVEVNGDEIWVIVGPKGNPRPSKKYIYYFSSLSGGASRSL